jgi:hypothetical protein
MSISQQLVKVIGFRNQVDYKSGEIKAQNITVSQEYLEETENQQGVMCKEWYFKYDLSNKNLQPFTTIDPDQKYMLYLDVTEFKDTTNQRLIKIEAL